MFALVLGLSFILLLVAFRSLVIPAKAILMNLLSVAAAYGLITLVFIKGWGAGVLGFQQVPVVEQWVPLFLFAVLFGLSMDYQVFLLSRIKEAWDRTGDNTLAVTEGVRSTAGIITGAALIMVAVFAGFASGDLVMFQQVGFGLGVAVLLDATLIRSVMVPAAMKLLGAGTGTCPRGCGWLPHLSIEGAPALAAGEDGSAQRRLEAPGCRECATRPPARCRASALPEARRCGGRRTGPAARRAAGPVAVAPSARLAGRPARQGRPAGAACAVPPRVMDTAAPTSASTAPVSMA